VQTPTDQLDNEEVVEVLNELIENCKDGEYGFRSCATNATGADIKSLFERRAQDCKSAADELGAAVIDLGGKPEHDGTVSGAAHRGWVTVRAAFSSNEDLAMLEECERGEDKALERYKEAVAQPLPAGIGSLIARQMAGTRANHDQIRALRDRMKHTTRA